MSIPAISRRGIIAALLAGMARMARGQTLKFEAAKTEPDWIQISSNDADSFLIVKARGREIKLTLAEVMTALASVPPAWESGQALNNQCPVCGTTAEPYVRPTETVAEDYQTTDDGRVIAINPHEEPYGPKEQSIRCTRCNVAFYQDAA
jgi:nucleoside diphosphate kinase